MNRRLVAVFALASLFALAGNPAIMHAQIAGTITGTVTDQSDVVVPSADVVITNSDTGVVALTLKTDSSGIYVAEALPVGTYQVAVEAHEFQRSVHSGISLSVADRLNISFVLKLGEVSQSVGVKAAVPLVQTQSGEQSQLRFISARSK